MSSTVPYLANQVFIHWLCLTGSAAIALMAVGMYWLNIYALHRLITVLAQGKAAQS